MILKEVNIRASYQSLLGFHQNITKSLVNRVKHYYSIEP
jgi:hypothetical protein